MEPAAPTLLDIEFPLFEEATQTASRFLGVPICFVGIPAGGALVLKAAIGLSRLGLMNPLARTRRLPLEDGLVSRVLQNQKPLVLPTLADQEPFAQSCLVQEYGIQSYLGMPLLSSEGHCLGILAVMDVQPGNFGAEAIAFMELLARWSMSEYERHQLTQTVAMTRTAALPMMASQAVVQGCMLDTVRLTLMSQLTQDMRNPLTTISGMSNMLSREIYGTLTPKQREYADIVRTSSQVLLEIAHEVLDLSSLDARLQPLNPTSVDVEMIGQHVQRMLTPIAQKNNQEIHISVEPGSRLWTLDRDIVRQLLYHLVFSIINLSGEGGTIRIHGSERENCLNLSLWLAHPWLGEGLPNAIVSLYQRLCHPDEERQILSVLLAKATGRIDLIAAETQDASAIDVSELGPLQSREILSLLLSRHLIERHGGTLSLQGHADASYRFLIGLPFLKATTVEPSPLP